MPLFLIAPLLSGAAGFVGGWWAGDSFGWVKWLLLAVIAWFIAVKMGVI